MVGNRDQLDGIEYLIMKRSDIIGVFVEAESRKMAA